ncbi:MAG TPA: hypothetical protein VMZ29_15695 [Candidatus Bathyarchaeia archaeon]|nr:hypothetical protein [Candidatus Bathyarchaeia archaeon]
MIELISNISLQNIMPVDWIAYLPLIGGVLGFIIAFSVIIIIVSWIKKRRAQQQMIVPIKIDN